LGVSFALKKGLFKKAFFLPPFLKGAGVGVGSLKRPLPLPLAL